MDKIILENILNAQKEYNELGNENIKYTDEQFDSLVDFVEAETGKELNLIGMKPSERVTKLPYPMPSINKASSKNTVKFLEDFTSKFECEMIISDKMDGISILCVYEDGNLKIYNRGDGIYGQEITYISKYINFPKIKDNISVRGELILDKKDFNYIQENMKSDKNKTRKARNLVNGSIFRKNDTNTILPYCKFYTFEIVNKELTPEEHIIQLNEYGFMTVSYSIVQFINYEIMKELLFQRRNNAFYEIDGLIICPNIKFPYPIENENPKNKIAFKINTNVVTQVTNVEWLLTSRYGVLNPVVHVTPVNILGSDVSKFTGHNARYILENKLGIGAIIMICLSGDIIPQLVMTITASENYPPVPYNYHWNSSNIEIVINDLNHPDIKIQEIYMFFNHLKVDGFGVKTIEKIYKNTNLRTIDDFIGLKSEDIKNIQGLGEKSAINIYEEIQKGIKNATYASLMAATGFFGEGIAKDRFQLFIDSFPQWIYCDILPEMIEGIKGFGKILSNQISSNLPIFKEWILERPFLMNQNKIIVEINQDLKGQVVVFTGFRDDDLQYNLEKRGAKVKNSFTKDITIIVVSDINSNSSKIQKAKENPNIKIVLKTYFK